MLLQSSQVSPLRPPPPTSVPAPAVSPHTVIHLVMAFWKLKMGNKPVFPALYFRLTTPWPPSRVIYADNLSDAAQHRKDADFLL